MTQSIFEGFGGLSLPEDASGVTTTLTPLDPARAVLSGLFSTAINAELGPVWALATTGTPLEKSNPIADILELPPTGQRMKQRKPTFPLFCVYRDGQGTLEQATLNGMVEKLTQPWTLDYIIGPVDIGDLRKLGDIFQAVVKVVRLVIRRRGHPAYLNGALQFFPPIDQHGHVPIFPESSFIGAIELNSYSGPPTYQAQFAGDESGTIYHAVSMHLTTVEHTYDVADADPPLDDFTLNINIGGGDGKIGGLLYADTAVPYQNP